MDILLYNEYSLSMKTLMMDATTITTTATTTSERLAAEENSKTGAAEAAPVEGTRLQCSKCKKKQ